MKKDRGQLYTAITRNDTNCLQMMSLVAILHLIKSHSILYQKNAQIFATIHFIFKHNALICNTKNFRKMQAVFEEILQILTSERMLSLKGC